MRSRGSDAGLGRPIMRPCKSCARRYLLDWVEGQPVFRRDEVDLAIEEAINDAYGKAEDRGDEIVPRVLDFEER
jgi:hypothetical protein